MWICCAVLAGADNSHAEKRLSLGDWASIKGGGLPENWRPITFPSIPAATSYEIVQDQAYGHVVRAHSFRGAGAIGRSLSVNPHDYPVLNWSWKIAGTLPGSSLAHENGDDFPARVMVSFKTEGASRRGVQDNILCYVWASTEPIGSVADNPVHSHIKTFVAASGSDRSGDWQEMSRNLVDDYRLAFSEAPGTLTGVVLMTDTDNTDAEARAWYGPIWLSGDVDGGLQTLEKRSAEDEKMRR
jgi:hypothetical protein